MLLFMYAKQMQHSGDKDQKKFSLTEYILTSDHMGLERTEENIKLGSTL